MRTRAGVIAPPLIEAAVEVQSALSAGGIRSCVIGGLAVQRWGEPRATQDVDFSVLAPIGEEQRPLDLLLAAFTARRPDARAFAIANRVLLIQSSNGVASDIGLAGSNFRAPAPSHTPPRLGEHTREILEGLGLEASQPVKG